MSDNNPVKQRLHITFGKFDALVYTSNLDVAKLWERVLRRANLPILYSEGFNPRPRLALATALPLGISSECEILDVSLRDVITLDGLAKRILMTSPVGLRIYGIREVPGRSPSLASQVRSAEYRIRFEDKVDREALQGKIDTILQSDTLTLEKERDGKTMSVNVRSFVHELRIDENNDLLAHLSVGDHGNLRPDQLLEKLGLGDHTVSVHRFRLHLEPEKQN
jgi:radical SAM-linked protein